MAFQSIQLLIALVTIIAFIRADHHDINTSSDVIKPLVGGRLARVGQFPWMAVIHQLKSGRRIAMCGGTVLSTRWVLTAGHCVFDFPRKFLVVFGEIDKGNIAYDYYQGPGVSMITTRGALHPQYGKTINDIALLYMPRDIRLDGVIQPIQLASSANENQLLSRGRATIVGWGKEGHHSTGSRYLKFGQIPLISNAYCSNFWDVDRGVICTQPRTGTDACEGDSGGPLVVQINNRYIQIGIVSYGDANCPSSRPGVFTRVSAFGWWIEQVTVIVKDIMSSIIYSRDEVACHDGKSGNGVWIIIKNIVYDVTEYLDEHPGGGDLVLEYAGKDATNAFNDFGHSSDAMKILKLHKIGQVTEVKRTKDKSKGKKIKNTDTMEMDAVKRKNRSFLFPLFRNCSL